MDLKTPKHIAVIPDGNRRWAKERGLPAFLGHREGVKALEKILLTALDLKIPYFTFWGCSISNITKRPPEEIKFLFELFEEMFKKLAKEPLIHDNKICIRALGSWADMFPPGAKAAVEACIDATKDYSGLNLTFLLAYNGDEEMLSAIQSIVNKTKSNPSLPITAETLRENLYTKDLPMVDLIIRTGGDPHLSTGFLMWYVGDAQLYFSDNLWPDFKPDEFQKAITEYGQSARRGGA